MKKYYNLQESTLKLKSLKEIKNYEQLDRIFSMWSSSLKMWKQKKQQNDINLQEEAKNFRLKKNVNTFIYKLRRNIARDIQVDYNVIQDKIIEKKREQTFVKSYKINQDLKASLISMDIVCILVIQTLSTFQGFYDDFNRQDSLSLPVVFIEIFCLVVFFLKLVIGFTTPRLSHGKNNEYMRYVSQQYVTSIIFVFNFFNFFMTILKLVFPDNKAVGIVSFIISVLSMPVLTEDLQIVEATWINNFRKKQYFAMFKVLLFNLFFVQFISTLLIAVTYFDSEYNWIHKAITAGHMRADLSWWQQYFYALYWAIVTMATIGFGDLTPANYLETAVLCILMLVGTTVLSFNISSIGSIVESLRKVDQERQKETIIFKRMCKDEKITTDLQNKILDCLYKSAQFSTEFDFIQKTDFMNKLPTQIQNDLQRQYANNIYSKIPFFRLLGQQTLVKLFLKLKGQIYYPGQEMIIIDGRLNKIKFLKKGRIGFTYQKPGSKLNGLILESRQIDKNMTHPYLLNKNLLSRTKKINYRLQAQTYCVMLELQHNEFQDIIRENQRDKQLYFSLANTTSILDHEWDIFECNLCAPKKHTIFFCPKLHYIPYKSLVVDKYLLTPSIFQKPFRDFTRKQNRLKRKKALQFWKLYFQEYEKQWQINYHKRVHKQNTIFNKEKQPQILDESPVTASTMMNLRAPALTKDYLSERDFLLDLSEKILNLYLVQNNKNVTSQSQTLQIDKMYNFNNFFPKYNSENLFKRSLKTRKRRPFDKSIQEFDIKIKMVSEKLIDYK